MMTRRQSLHTLAATALAGCQQGTTESPVERSLRMIRELDKTGPTLNAVIEINPEAAHAHGTPVLIKDNIETADAMHTTAGSLALMASRPKRDADVVEKLRKAGFVIVGKTNLSEWANIRSPKSTSGWSARGGLTRNPHRLAYNTSGSSSGSAAAIAAGYAPFAIGTETNGSIVSPASACGIVGLKPTLGLVSQRGIIPITHHQDTAGPMTRTVSDAVKLLEVIADSEAVSSHRLSFSLEANALRGKRLGVLRSMVGDNAGVLSVFGRALQALREAGAEIIDNVTLPNEKQAGQASWAALFVELRMDLNAYLHERDGEVKSLSDLIAFNERHRDEEMPYFEQEFFERAEALKSMEIIAAATDARASAKKLAGPEGIDEALRAHKLDALICPTHDPIHRTDLVHGDTHGRGFSTPAAVAGYPHLTVPMGFVDDLPVGLSFTSTAWSDGLLLSLGNAFEEALPAFREPKFLA